MGRRSAQGVVEYLLVSGIILITIGWAIHHLFGVEGKVVNLEESLSTADSEFNRKALSEIISNINSD